MSQTTSTEVGFDRTIRRDWADAAVSLVAAGLPEEQIRKELRARLESDLPGKEARRKVITILLRLWIRPVGYVQVLRNEALALWNRISPQDRLVLHWGLALAAYPFFHEFAQQVGRIARLQERFSTEQIHRRMRERFGDREVVHRAGRHVLYTFADWQVIAPEGRKGTYRANLSREMASWLVESEISALGSRAASLPSVVQAPALFPFQLPGAGQIRAYQAERLEFTRQGMDEEFVALRR